jgi:hypothetical protein
MVVYADNKTMDTSIADPKEKASREIFPLTSYIVHNKSVPGFD